MILPTLGINYLSCQRAQAKEREMTAGTFELAEGHAATPPSFWKLYGGHLEGHYHQVVTFRRNIMFCLQVSNFI